MAEVTDLGAFLNAYGVGVRAGVITPCIEDEVYMREVFGLPKMPESVRRDWDKTDNIRKPITLAGANGGPLPALQDATQVEDDDSEET